MKYYLIVGEASGDLHASHLMHALKQRDPAASFRYFGGDMMAAEGGTLVKHYRELAYMGLFPVLMHLPTILRNMRHCKQDIADWQPDVVILVDYPGFNLSIAKYVHRLREQSTRTATGLPAWRPKVFYYIAPKLWAWKEYRIKNIKRDVDELFSILPFEVAFFEGKHHYPIHYVGNPTASEVSHFLSVSGEQSAGKGGKPVIALLAGSRKQEIDDNLPAMIAATRHLADRYDIVLAGAPSISTDYYTPFLADTGVRLVGNATYPLLAQATAALVTSGTATLETCMFRVPQVVCYRMGMPRVMGFLRRHFTNIHFVSLVNLIADSEVVAELVADTFSPERLRRELDAILPGGERREAMLTGYEEVHRRLGESDAPDRAAETMIALLRKV